MRRKIEAESFLGFSKNESGDSAVAASRASSELKSANQSGAFRDAYNESQYGNTYHVFKQQATRRIAGKTFFQNASGWIDSLASDESYKELIKIKFGSDSYFKLLYQAPENAKWLSVGTNLQIVINEKLYEITHSK